MFFQLLDAFAGHSRGQSQIPPARRDAAQFHDARKDPKAFDILHDVLLSPPGPPVLAGFSEHRGGLIFNDLLKVFSE